MSTAEWVNAVLALAGIIFAGGAHWRITSHMQAGPPFVHPPRVPPRPPASSPPPAPPAA